MNSIRLLITLLAILSMILLASCERSLPSSADDHVQRALKHEQKGDLVAAVIELKNAVQREPDNAKVRWLLGELYLKSGQGAEAEKELTKARELGVSEAAIKIPLARAMLLQRKYDAVLDKTVVQDQDSSTNRARLLQMRGDALIALRRVDEGCAHYRQSIGIEPQAAAHVGLARCALIAGNPDQARELLKSARRLDDKLADGWILLGDLETGLGNHAQARAAYSQALQRAPLNVEALYNRAKAAISLQDLAAARQDVALLRQQHPDTLHWRYLTAYLNLRDGKAREAQTHIQEVLRHNPDFLPGIVLAGAIAQALDAHQDALSHLGKALERDPGNPVIRRLLAVTQSKLGQQAQALQTLNPLLTRAEVEAGVLMLAGNVHLSLGQPDKAAAYFERAIAQGGDNPAARRALAAAQVGLGNIDNGLAELKALLNSDAGAADDDVVFVLSTLLRAQRYDELLATLDELERRRPPTAVMLNYRGAAYLGKRDEGQARRFFEQALAKDPTLMSAVMNLAELDLRDGKPEAARQRYEAVLKAAPGHAPAMLQLARLTQDPSRRLELLQRAARAAPQSLEPLQRMVEHHLALGEADKALVQARQMATLAPEDARTLLSLGAAQLATRDLAGAESSYARLTALAPERAEGHLNLGMARFALGRLEPAAAAYAQALRRNPELIEAYTGLILVHLRQRRYEQALAVARQVQQRWPRNNLGWALEGDVRSAQGRHDQAAAAYRAAFERQPTRATLLSLHRAERLSGDVKNSDKRLQDWLRQQPNDVAVRQALAMAYLQDGRDAEAIAELERVVALAPRQAAALNNLAWLYHKTGDARALATAQQAHRLSPNEPAIADTLGWILAQRGDYAQALPLLRQAAAAAPGHAEIRYHLAWALMHAGERAAARRELQALLRQHRDFPQRREAEALLARP